MLGADVGEMSELSCNCGKFSVRKKVGTPGGGVGGGSKVRFCVEIGGLDDRWVDVCGEPMSGWALVFSSSEKVGEVALSFGVVVATARSLSGDCSEEKRFSCEKELRTSSGAGANSAVSFSGAEMQSKSTE